MEINNYQKLQISNKCVANNNNDSRVKKTAESSLSFHGNMENVLSKTGDLMNWIEKGGFLVLFLIQDFLGMTVPRTVAGFLRDKEITGEYNIQEGFEVLGREGLTGPVMMAVAPMSLWLASKYCGQSSGINSELIKYYGNNLKELVTSDGFNRDILKDSVTFKEFFYKKNIEKILKSTLGDGNYSNESVEYILQQLKNYENIPKDVKLSKFMGKSKYHSSCMDNVVSHINNLKYNTSSELDMLRKVKLGSDLAKDNKIFDTAKAFEGLIKYSNDAISANKKLEKLDGLVAESIKHNALGKRALINVGMVAATLGLLSVLPKLYIRSNTAPGARIKSNINKRENSENTQVRQDTQPAFKGKDSNIINSIGKVVDKRKSSFISSELEYNGHNFTNTLMAALSIFGLLTPRCARAISRAQVDENGKKDLTEVWEIILRDVTSSLAVVFAVPMITRACVTSYEKNSGFVLMHKDRSAKSFLKSSLDLINPYSKAHVLSNAELSALYDNINTKEKFLNFCKYINKNNGNLQKILSKSESITELLNKAGLDITSLKNKTKSDSNNRMINLVQNLESKIQVSANISDKKEIDTMINKALKGLSKGGKSKITSFARGLNSVPGLLTTLFVSPYILGWAIPRLTYQNTRRIHEKKEMEKLKS